MERGLSRSIHTHQERGPQPLRREDVAVAAYAPTDPVPRGARAQRVAEHVAPDRTKAARGSGGPRVG